VLLYGENGDMTDDVHIWLNCYGGLCNAAVRMYDDIKSYPGKVGVTVSGTAASAGTVLASAAAWLEMTPGSLWMIHNPSTFAWGDVRAFNEVLNLLRVCKDSLLNIYCKRCKKPRNEISDMMDAATWMDAQAALDNGFIDAIADQENKGGATNAVADRVVDRKEAEAKVQAWLDRRKPQRVQQQAKPQPEQQPEQQPEPQNEKQAPVQSGVPIAQLDRRLELIKPPGKK